MMTETMPDERYIRTFTICPNDEQQHINSPCRIVMVHNHIRTILYDVLGDKFPYKLFTEITEPQNGQDGSIARIHFHGLIYLPPVDLITFYAEYFHRLNRYFRIEVDTIKNLEVFLNYCTKQRESMELYCKVYKVEYILHHKMAKPQSYDSFTKQIVTKRSKKNVINKPVKAYFSKYNKEGSGDSSPVLCDDDL